MLPKPSNTLSLPCFPLAVVGVPGNRPAGEITGISQLIISFDASWEGRRSSWHLCQAFAQRDHLAFLRWEKKKHPEHYAGL